MSLGWVFVVTAGLMAGFYIGMVRRRMRQLKYRRFREFLGDMEAWELFVMGVTFFVCSSNFLAGCIKLLSHPA